MKTMIMATAGAVMLAAPVPLAALTPIHAAAGEACQITSVGGFTCIWTDDEGVTSVADVGVGFTNELNRFSGSVHVPNAPLAGWIEIAVPYDAPEFSYNWLDYLNLGGSAYVYTVTSRDTSSRVIGTIDVETGFSSATNCPRIGCEGLGRVRARTYYGSSDFFHRRGVSLYDPGIWTMSMQWAFRDDSPAISLGAYLRLSVPEPASWAMMIAGFGLVGLASRRQTRRSDRQPG